MSEAPGHLAANVMHFGRLLRRAGLPLGSDRIRLALEALPIAGLASRDELHDVLAACFVARHEHQALFDEAFATFWRSPDLLGRMMAMLLPRVEGRKTGLEPAPNRRLAEAFSTKRAVQPVRDPDDDPLRFDATLTFSERERLMKVDFETMTTDEWNEARRVVAALDLRHECVATRRTERAAHGRIDWRDTMRRSARSGSLAWRRRRPRREPVPIVVLADISGSMSRYSRMLLHFAHALSSQNGAGSRRVSTFVFGTRLSPITRSIAARDPDAAVAAVVRTVDDWSGGTRIAGCLRDFNRDWSRRVLARNATVLLVTDGLEHGDAGRLSFETERLAKSCRKLIWLNPLLRFERFEPRAAGVRAMLPHVDRFVPAHDLASLAALARHLNGTAALATRASHPGRSSPPARGRPCN